MKVLSRNMAHRDLWDDVAASGVDVALLQEVAPPGPDRPLETIPAEISDWRTAGWEKCEWRTAIARLSSDISLTPVPVVPLHETSGNADLGVSRHGTLSAATVAVNGQPAVTLVSVYAKWERPLRRNEPCFADGSAHRLLSDLAPLLWDHRRHPVIVAGDWNILYRYGEHGDAGDALRYSTVFDRAHALGLRLVGPFDPNGRRAKPWPKELPLDSRCVPTFHHSQQNPATASRQLDFVFASASIAERVSVRALNGVEEWGRSDHCQIRIDVDI